MKIIVDTDILVSIYKEADSNHEKAVKIASANIENNLFILQNSFLNLAGKVQ